MNRFKVGESVRFKSYNPITKTYSEKEGKIKSLHFLGDEYWENNVEKKELRLISVTYKDGYNDDVVQVISPYQIVLEGMKYD